VRALIQRVDKSSVKINGKTYSSINKGILVFVGIKQSDDEKIIDWMIKKIINLRIFEDENGKMNLSVKDIKGEILIVSQFTLYGNCKKGNRPNYTDAAKPEIARQIYENFLDKLKKVYPYKVASGIFGAMMEIELINNGPVTLFIERD